jgi:hypothetical protein
VTPSAGHCLSQQARVYIYEKQIQPRRTPAGQAQVFRAYYNEQKVHTCDHAPTLPILGRVNCSGNLAGLLLHDFARVSPGLTCSIWPSTHDHEWPCVCECVTAQRLNLPERRSPAHSSSRDAGQEGSVHGVTGHGSFQDHRRCSVAPGSCYAASPEGRVQRLSRKDAVHNPSPLKERSLGWPNAELVCIPKASDPRQDL